MRTPLFKRLPYPKQPRKSYIGVLSTAVVLRRALIITAGVISQITNAQLGTGLKPLVILADGTIKERSTVEGTPLIMDNGVIRTLASGEGLQI